MNSFPEFQTVKWWIKQLKQFDPKSKVEVYTKVMGKRKCMLSIYEVIDNFEHAGYPKVYIDIGREE